MDREPDDLERHIATLRRVAQTPDDVTIGAFADAVLSLSAELRQLEQEIKAMNGELARALEEARPEPRSPSEDDRNQAAANTP